MRAIFLIALALAACAQSQGGAGPDQASPARSELSRRILADMQRLDAELSAPGVVSAGIGETADLGGGLTVRLLAVVEDSRCPANVTCVWAGRLRVRAAISGVSGERELTLGQPLETPNGAVLLAVAKPTPWQDWPAAEIGPRPPYRFGLRRP